MTEEQFKQRQGKHDILAHKEVNNEEYVKQEQEQEQEGAGTHVYNQERGRAKWYDVT